MSPPPGRDVQDGNPGKGPDHEISEVKWMSKGENDLFQCQAEPFLPIYSNGYGKPRISLL